MLQATAIKKPLRTALGREGLSQQCRPVRARTLAHHFKMHALLENQMTSTPCISGILCGLGILGIGHLGHLGPRLIFIWAWVSSSLGGEGQRLTTRKSSPSAMRRV